MIPTCLLEKLGQDVPSNRSYWASNDPLEQLDDWPDVGKPSPVVGYALDGFMIMGPYDEEGNLMVGRSVPARSTLDECNGKVGKDGEYRYYVTPNAPYNVACFKGSTVGNFVDQRVSDAACPKVGVQSRWCDPDAEGTDNCQLDMEEKCTNEPYEGPYFLFQANPKLDGPRWETYSLFFGLLFALTSTIAVFDVYKLLTSTGKVKVPASKFVSYGMVLIICWSRAFVLLVDPHYTREIVSPYIIGILYGLAYPALNAVIGLLLFLLYELVEGAKSMAKAKAGFLPKTKKLYVTMTFFQFVTQIIADAMRADGHAYDWLVVCQVYFIIWGALVCVVGFKWGLDLWKTLNPGFRKRSFKFFVNVLISTCIGFAMIISSMIKLTCALSENQYFTEMTVMRISEVAACCTFLYALAPERKLLESFSSRISSKQSSAKSSSRSSSRESSSMSSSSTSSVSIKEKKARAKVTPAK